MISNSKAEKGFVMDEIRKIKISHSQLYKLDKLTHQFRNQEDLIISNLLKLGYTLDDSSCEPLIDYLVYAMQHNDSNVIVYLMLKFTNYKTSVVYDLKKATIGTILENHTVYICDYYNQLTNKWMKNTKKACKVNSIDLCKGNMGVKFPSLPLYAFVKYTLSRSLLDNEKVDDEFLYNTIRLNINSFNEVLCQQKNSINGGWKNEIQEIRCSSGSLSKIGSQIAERKQSIKVF